MPWEDDPTIGDDTVLWRRAGTGLCGITVDASGALSVSSAVFLTDEMSVHIAALADAGEILAKYPGYRILAITAGLVRQQGCVVVKRPTEDDASHALVVRPDGKRLSKSAAKRIAQAAVLVP